MPGEWASPERPTLRFEGVLIFSPPPPEPGCGRVAVLGCVLGGEQSGEICTFGGLQQPGKACRVDGHHQRGLIRDLDGFRCFSPPPLSLGVAV